MNTPFSLQGKRVLVSGAGGFIGSHLVEKLVDVGAEVRAMVHYNSSGSWGWLDHSKFKGEIEVVAGDACDRDSVRLAMRDREIIFHLAALIGIPYSYCAPISYIRTNIEGTFNFLSEARYFGIERFVHTSTSEVYGTAQYVPIDESHVQVGQSPYSASKIGADKMVEAFQSSYGVPASIIRPFNTYGPRQSARAIIPTIITQALSNDQVFLGNLEATRDFNFVLDLVNAYIDIAVNPEAIGKTVNIGTGREISIGELAEIIFSAVEKPHIKIVKDSNRLRPDSSEVDRLCCDNRLAMDFLDWRPEYSFEEGLKETVRWIRSNLEMYRTDVYAI